MGVQLSFGRSIQTVVAVAFGLGFLAFGIAGFVHIDSSEQRIEAKLHSIRAGVIQPDTLTVVKKYVNPGRSGLPHLVFSSARLPKVDISATRDFFNSVNLGETIRGYYFPDGYFIPENHRGTTGASKWFSLGLGVLVGGAALALARVTSHSGPASRAASVL
jgi:hypothetical protein